MGNTGARHFGYEKAFVPVDDSADFVLGQVGSSSMGLVDPGAIANITQIEKATREQTSGKFVTIDKEREYNEW